MFTSGVSHTGVRRMRHKHCWISHNGAVRRQQMFTSFPQHCRGYNGDSLDVAYLLTFIFTGPLCKYFSR